MQKCDTCGYAHEALPGALGYVKPYQYFRVPEADRSRRVKVNSDLCQVDDNIFALRGVIEIPLLDGATIEGTSWFEFGIWAVVAPAYFYRYLELYDVDGSSEEPFSCLLDGEPPGYDGLLGHPAEVHLRQVGQRPLFKLRPSDHRMYLEQTNGITLRQVHEIFRAGRPDYFSAL
jgi:hypothetical protein